MKVTPFSVSLLSLVFYLAPLGCQARPLRFPGGHKSPISASVPLTPSSSIEQSPPVVALRSNTIASLEMGAFQKINQYRTQNGLPRLVVDPVLTQQARAHSQAMVASRKLSHDGFDRRFQVITQTLPIRAVAENVAYNNGFSNPVQVAVSGWIKSPGHHTNIVGNYDRTGLGVAVSADGNYYFTQIFGRSR